MSAPSPPPSHPFFPPSPGQASRKAKGLHRTGAPIAADLVTPPDAYHLPSPFQLEQTVTKLQTVLALSPDQVATLPPPLVRIRELEEENEILHREIDDLRRQLEQRNARLRPDITRRTDLLTLADDGDRDGRRRRLADSTLYMVRTLPWPLHAANASLTPRAAELLRLVVAELDGLAVPRRPTPSDDTPLDEQQLTYRLAAVCRVPAHGGVLFLPALLRPAGLPHAKHSLWVELDLEPVILGEYLFRSARFVVLHIGAPGELWILVTVFLSSHQQPSDYEPPAQAHTRPATAAAAAAPAPQNLLSPYSHAANDYNNFVKLEDECYQASRRRF
ncbi:uncharacterized protein FIBRA_08767 [Fibroporia radiculosa]|uniref:Uncharacterized protein n=1 Tax=Fibroporia radiculosa TaxID=599839 RepID=J4I3A7_9APHY|nr:uncharacterized protein FIBRA_08767 [Fibroporia radiculosa]CCM06497.1 predicted protein [Fibroporia radiculosa]